MSQSSSRCAPVCLCACVPLILIVHSSVLAAVLPSCTPAGVCQGACNASACDVCCEHIVGAAVLPSHVRISLADVMLWMEMLLEDDDAGQGSEALVLP